MTAAPMIVFTICARNYLGYAQALWQSLTAHHDNVLFHVALCDDASDFDALTYGFDIIQVSDLGMARWAEMRASYNITELNTALKPFVFLLLFGRYPGQPILYLDPDILVFSPFIEVQALLDGGADCILTPHIVAPSEFAEMNDQQFLRYGIYNLGFCVLRALPEVRRVVAWWARRLETHCVIALEEGLFVDQKWADLFPAYIDRTAILRHPGYNVAYWNLSQRLVRVDGAGHWSVNGEALRFFHFSGNRIETRSFFSRHSEVFSIGTIGDVRKLLDIYRESVMAHGHAYYSGIPYAFSWSQGDGRHVHSPAGIEAERRAAASPMPFLPITAQPIHAAERRSVDRLIERRLWDGENIPGFCALCHAPSRFDGEPRAANWGRSLHCLTCRQPSHIRAVATLLAQRCRPGHRPRVSTNHPTLLDCDGLRERVTGGDRPPADILVLCQSGTGRDLDRSLAAGYDSLRAGGDVLLTDGDDAPDAEARLGAAGFRDITRLFYWSRGLAHFGENLTILAARKPPLLDRQA
ncbi:hypothetical protein [Acidisoma silvae]|uniref:Glycosyl transferase n=1 Tax=Acidisoma silvae TaxID=2802396 RepID=A0A963YMK9_9PROT|nr:hypothetical protein [Acidisoma silvae]MCB8873592.1 hypothetical protein [Acidisoma silvae]